MEPKQIIQQLNAKGYNQMMIAAALGRSPSLVSKVINRRAKSSAVARLIADVLNLDVTQVFPECNLYSVGQHNKNEFYRKVAYLKSKFVQQ